MTNIGRVVIVFIVRLYFKVICDALGTSPKPSKIQIIHFNKVKLIKISHSLIEL